METNSEKEIIEDIISCADDVICINKVDNDNIELKYSFYEDNYDWDFTELEETCNISKLNMGMVYMEDYDIITLFKESSIKDDVISFLSTIIRWLERKTEELFQENSDLENEIDDLNNED